MGGLQISLVLNILIKLQWRATNLWENQLSSLLDGQKHQNKSPMDFHVTQTKVCCC